MRLKRTAADMGFWPAWSLPLPREIEERVIAAKRKADAKRNAPKSRKRAANAVR